MMSGRQMNTKYVVWRLDKGDSDVIGLNGVYGVSKKCGLDRQTCKNPLKLRRVEEEGTRRHVETPCDLANERTWCWSS